MANRDLRPESVQATPNVIPFPDRPRRAAPWPHDLPPFDPTNPVHVRSWRNLVECGRAMAESDAERAVRGIPTDEQVLSEAHRNRLERIVEHLLAMLDASDAADGNEDDDPLEPNGDELDASYSTAFSEHQGMSGLDPRNWPDLPGSGEDTESDDDPI